MGPMLGKWLTTSIKKKILAEEVAAKRIVMGRIFFIQI
jgi:hypothetical protein